MNKAEYEFANFVRACVFNNPEWLRTAIDAACAGSFASIEQAAKDRSEWEVIAINAMEARLFSRNKGWLADMIEKHKGRTSMQWDRIIERLRK